MSVAVLPPALTLEGVSKAFGGLQAVADLSATVAEGRFFAIIGPNGSGKTTLFNLITGFLRADHGAIRFRHTDITGLRPYQTLNVGLARTFQLVEPFLGLSVHETLMVPCRSPRIRRHGWSRPRVEEHIRAVAEEVGLAARLETRVDDLNHGELRLLDIGRALASEPDLLLLDEPFSSLSQREIDVVSRTLVRLNQSGLTIVIIEHKLRPLMRLVSEVLVLNFGRKIAQGAPEEIIKNPDVVAAYLGKSGALGLGPARAR